MEKIGEETTAPNRVYGKLPIFVAQFNTISLEEVMYYLYLPVVMDWDRGQGDIRLPPNLEGGVHEMISMAMLHSLRHNKRAYRYVYLSARKGWATPDNPLNRPGWHCDGFGTNDVNYIWWTGPGTRFAIQPFQGIVSDHNRSMKQFDEQVNPALVTTYPEKGLFMIDPSVVHATPIIEPPGCMRQYIKISMSDAQYNLENNSHNYLFNYRWRMHSRDTIRNDPHRSQLDYYS